MSTSTSSPPPCSPVPVSRRSPQRPRRAPTGGRWLAYPQLCNAQARRYVLGRPARPRHAPSSHRAGGGRIGQPAVLRAGFRPRAHRRTPGAGAPGRRVSRRHPRKGCLHGEVVADRAGPPGTQDRDRGVQRAQRVHRVRRAQTRPAPICSAPTTATKWTSVASSSEALAPGDPGAGHAPTRRRRRSAGRRRGAGPGHPCRRHRFRRWRCPRRPRRLSPQPRGRPGSTPGPRRWPGPGRRGVAELARSAAGRGAGRRSPRQRRTGLRSARPRDCQPDRCARPAAGTTRGTVGRVTLGRVTVGRVTVGPSRSDRAARDRAPPRRRRRGRGRPGRAHPRRTRRPR